MKRIIAFVVVPMLMGALAACDDLVGDEEEIVFTVDQDRYAAGDTVRVTLVNRTDDPIDANLCFSDVDVRTEDGWEQTGIVPELPCPATFPLDPGESGSRDIPLPLDTPDGEYRVRTTVNGDDEVTTRSFMVGAQPVAP